MTETYDRESFEAAAKPLIKWLCDNTNPHATVIVTPTYAELLNGEMACRTTEFVRD